MYRCGQSLQGIMYIAFFVCFDAVLSLCFVKYVLSLCVGLCATSTVGKQDKKLGHENGPTNNFLSLGWNITKLPHRIELDIPKNRMFFVFRICYILAGK